jgi:hypothetical protein
MGGGRFTRLLTILAAAAFVAAPRIAGAHVGSPDVFVDTHAGPYHVFVTVRPPYAIPGIADVEIVVPDGGVDRLRVAPLPLTGPGARFAPAPDVAKPSQGQANVFTASLWMMSAGAWQVRLDAEGSRGPGAAAVPVPTLPQATLTMSRALGALLAVLLALLAGGLVAIVAAVARDATLPPGETADWRARRRGRIAGVAAACAVAAVVLLGDWWWTAEAANYSRYVYKPLTMETSVTRDGTLSLALRDPGWIALRRVDDLVADHGHLMHLFVVSPALDRLWHLHPAARAPGTFEQTLPPTDGAGRYSLFADVVHATGISETVTAALDAPAAAGHDLEGDDSAWQLAQPVESDVSALAGGGRMVRVHGTEALHPRALTLLTFRVEDANGAPVDDLELYMGMPGHAIVIRRDGSVFAHLHPSGSAPMAAMEIGQRALASANGPSAPPSEHQHHAAALPPEITFPYGFPAAGDYRIFVQVKRRGHIETGAFDVGVR